MDLDTYLEAFRDANEFMIKGENAKSLDIYDLLLTKSIEDPQVLYSTGTLYSEVGKFGLAIQFFKRSLELDPHQPQCWNNLAICYRHGGHDDLAKASYEKSLELNYDAMTLANYCGLYVNAGNPDECIRIADEAIALCPDLSQALTHKGLALLEKGEWEEGFRLYRNRMRMPYFHRREYGVHEWKGQEVECLSIHGEQGLGDEIMFLSVIPKIREKAKRIVVECSPRHLALFKNSFPDVYFYGTHEEIMKSEKVNAWIAMGCLPIHTGFVKNPDGYLTPSVIYPKGEKFRIGLSFRGGTKLTHEHLRNFPIEWWSPLTQFDAEIVSIQHGPAAGLSSKLGIKHDQEWMDDVDKLCAVIKSCDIVITVCGTAVHMAGAMNVPAYVLVPSKPAWRYGIKGERMPWYDSPFMIRQEQNEAWTSVVERVKAKVLEDHPFLKQEAPKPFKLERVA